MEYIRDLYPEYFSRTSSIGSLEYRSNVNSGYQKWIEDLKVTADWIHSFPTTDIFLGYMNYCKDYNFPWMGKKFFIKH
nr:MAG TPA: RFX DNA-binding domain protein [Caudoviricetes sp.]